MDTKLILEDLLQRIDEDKRDEAYAKLAAVETRAEKLAIFAEYGVMIPDEDDELPEGWEETARELTDEQLEQVSGGLDWQRDCNCEP